MRKTRTYHIAITGSFASGKSTVAEFFKNKGYTIVSADQIGHSLLEQDRVKELLVREFGTDILSNKKIERKKLAMRVFSDKKALKTLNDLLHPKIINELKRIVKESNEEIVLFEVPLLFEVGIESLFDLTVNIEATPVKRKQRLLKKGYLTDKEIDERFASQLREDFKREKADLTIDNNGSIKELYLQLEVISQIISKKLLINSTTN
ncbi:MAG: dephospho-CoA kinase [Candidatus Pacebacteria bacterium]|nr:dephospho-CoA kinase [Candidatus Paceibacterota bacterium]